MILSTDAIVPVGQLKEIVSLSVDPEDPGYLATEQLEESIVFQDKKL